MTTKTNRFSPEVRERAVRLVQEHRADYPSLWAAVASIAPRIGCVLQTLLEATGRVLMNESTAPSMTAIGCREQHDR